MTNGINRRRSIVKEVKKVDYAFVDATFLNKKEVKKTITEVPHPFIEETVKLFKTKKIEQLGFRFASERQNYGF